MEWADFKTLWEARLLAVAAPFLDPCPELVEGSGLAEWVDGAAMGVFVDPLEEYPPRSGYWRCRVRVEYDYSKRDDAEAISKTWGQILHAFGDGVDGGSKLRTRLADGKLMIPGGIDSVMYDGTIEHDESGGVHAWEFTAHLGIKL